jgi:hypothetical protein
LAVLICLPFFNEANAENINKGAKEKIIFELLGIGKCKSGAERYRDLPVSIPEEQFIIWNTEVSGMETRPIEKANSDDDILCVVVTLKNVTAAKRQYDLKPTEISLSGISSGRKVGVLDFSPCGIFMQYSALNQVIHYPAGNKYPDGSEMALIPIIKASRCVLPPDGKTFIILYFVVPKTMTNGELWIDKDNEINLDWRKK